MYSIIIPSIGRIKYLNELLISIYNQSLFPQEIIILLDKNKKCEEISNFINKKDLCRSQFLLEYFNEKNSEKCNICDICTNNNKNEIF